jgi:hypothetical protein
MVKVPLREPKTAPPENVAFIAPTIALLLSVLKKARKFGDAITS